MRNPSLLLWIAAAAVLALVAIGYVIAAAVKFADDSSDDDADWNRAVDHCGWVDIPGGPTNTARDDAEPPFHAERSNR